MRNLLDIPTEILLARYKITAGNSEFTGYFRKDIIGGTTYKKKASFIQNSLGICSKILL